MDPTTRASVVMSLRAAAEVLSSRLVFRREPSTHDDFILNVYEGKEAVGRMEIELLFNAAIHDDGEPHRIRKCPDALAKLIDQGADEEASVWVVRQSNLEEHLQGKGHGRRMYVESFKTLAERNSGAVFVASDECGEVTRHGTTQAAKGVWKSLAREFPAHGEVLYVEAG